MNVEMNISEMIRSIDKDKMYNSEEQINFDDIINLLQIINDCYKTDNSKKFIEIKKQLEGKFNIIIANHFNNENIMLKNIQKNIILVEETTKTFKNIID